MKTLNLIALTLVIVGGLNWLLVGAFQFDLVATLFGGGDTPLARIVYCLVGIAALYCLTFYRYVSATTTNTVGYNKTASNTI